MSANSPGDLNAEFQQILAHYQQSVTAQLQTAKNTLRTVILPALLQSGVANVEAAYSGYGDSGAIDGVQYRDKSGVRVEREKIPAALTDTLENVLYEFLPAGFEINEGSQGTLTLDISASRITLTHQENDTGSHGSTREFDL
jgi:uncharacterized protein YfaS (alpha-2-macroglobulin family)